MNARSCSCSVELQIRISSAIPVTFGMPLYTSSSLRWKYILRNDGSEG